MKKFEHYYIGAIKAQHDANKNKTENKTVEIKMGTLDIQTNIIIPGMELEFLFAKNEYGTNQLFQVLDEKQCQLILISRRES